jgi:hypothetical protein
MKSSIPIYLWLNYVSSSEYVVSNDRMINNEKQIENEVEESGRGRI